MAVLITGAAGFIGFHVARALLDRGERVIGIDNLNHYYDVRLKRARLDQIRRSAFTFCQIDVSDRQAIEDLCVSTPDITRVIHLAAQAGVRHSMVDPYAYVTSNVMGHLVMLEAARRMPRLEHFVYASSSSVYGLNKELPFEETQRVDQPSSLYAVTKRAEELMSSAYGHLYATPQTGLRFFTVYGPWGRPDMAYYSFAKAIMVGKPITLYDGGRLQRDFTYIEDIVAGILGVADHVPTSGAHRILNIGNHRREYVATLVSLLEQALGQKAIIKYIPRPVADVEATWASVKAIANLTGYEPSTPLSVGIPRFIEWLRDSRF
jgi:UDP-glucuronate 4-epimerase